MFRVVLIEHGYASTDIERDIVEQGGGEFIDAGNLPLAKALELCREAEGVMLRRIDVTRALIQQWRKCKVIVRYGVGTDNVDVKAATEAGIIVGHVPSYCIDEVSSHTIALWLACARKVVSTHKRMEQGSWDVHRHDPIYRIAGKTLGIVGFGNIGRDVARKLAGWNLKLLAFDPFVEVETARSLGVEPVDIEALCRRSDFITLHAPLLPETWHMINAQSLGWMRSGAVLVNTARGPVVDTAALLQALDAGHLAAAGIDVFEEEPLPKNSPLRNHPRVVVTDHTAWYSEESQRDLQRMAAEEAVRVCRGELPKSLVNPEVLDRLRRRAEWMPGENMRWQLKRLEQLRMKRDCG